MILGSHDRRRQPSSAQDYRRVPDARIEILDGVGHTPVIEDPDTAGALLHGFALQTAPR
ncbi:alpha/beta fold hydrolase [Streptomyces sp. NPDC056231]|uniref:alpha/beta fold hydrolase n=1 Tax=Streptomyces sp. NPDC056231 TaxID=3345755 RepID=UPI003AAFE827